MAVKIWSKRLVMIVGRAIRPGRLMIFDEMPRLNSPADKNSISGSERGAGTHEACICLRYGTASPLTTLQLRGVVSWL
jgi:hypothetical protein